MAVQVRQSREGGFFDSPQLRRLFSTFVLLTLTSRWLRISLSIGRYETKGSRMSDWLGGEIDQIKAQVVHRAKQENLQMHRAQVLKVKAPGFFSAVVQELSRAIARLHQEIPDPVDQVRIVSGPSPWLVFRGQNAQVVLDPSGLLV